MFSTNRIVAVLTPIFAAGAAVGSAWLAKHFPGVQVSSGEILALEITGATAATGAALSWLKGHQAYEKRLDEGLIVAKELEAKVTKADPQLLAEIKAYAETEVQKLLADVSVHVQTSKPEAPKPTAVK
jgi:hypothetical protein